MSELEDMIEAVRAAAKAATLDDDDLNNILMTGAIYMTLLQGGMHPEVVSTPQGDATNVLTVGAEFLKSRYRVEVTRIDEGP